MSKKFRLIEGKHCDRDPRFLHFDLRAAPGTDASPYTDKRDPDTRALLPKVPFGHPDSPFADDQTLKTVDYAVDYVKGTFPIVESNADLTKLNRPPGRKFEPLSETGGSMDPSLNPMLRQSGESAKQYADRIRAIADVAEEEAVSDELKTLEAMTVEELQGYAKTAGIDFEAADPKKLLISKILAETTAVG